MGIKVSGNFSRSMNSDSKIKIIIKNIISPTLLSYIRRNVLHLYGFFGDYPSYGDAMKHCGGYESDSVVQRVAANARTRKYSLWIDDRTRQLLSAFAYISNGIEKRGSMNVLDFGGGLGDHYAIFKNFFGGKIKFKWMICETPAMAQAGKNEFSNSELFFIDKIAQAEDSGILFDAILASSSLQYVDDPDKYFNDLSQLKAKFIILNRLPFTPLQKDRITIQKVPREIYSGSYPAWFFSEQKWLALLQKDHSIVMRWMVPQDSLNLGIRQIPYQGMLLERK